MGTIDKKVKKVLDTELKKMSQSQKEVNDLILQLDKLNSNQTSEYNISPKDTIGKNICFNTIRK